MRSRCTLHDAHADARHAIGEGGGRRAARRSGQPTRVARHGALHKQRSPRGDKIAGLALATALGLAACGGRGGGHASDAGNDSKDPGSPPATRAQLTFESGPVRPVALSADAKQAFVANTPNGSLDILQVSETGLAVTGSVKVGIDPVAVAVRSAGEVWVVNHVSDSVSIVDVARTPPRVVRTLLVGDEPSDIVFASGRAFITTAHRGQQRSSAALAGVPGAGDPQLTTPGIGRADVWVFDPADLGSALGGRPLAIVTLFGDTPRGLAVSPDGATVYAAVFKSGNRTTSTGVTLPCPGFDRSAPCTVEGAPVPGSAAGPATNHAGIPAPRVGVILQADAAGAWRDVRGLDWSATTRFALPDQDVFAIDAAALTPTAAFAHVGTTLFNLAVNPRSGAVYVSNTEARNDLRFEGAGTFAGTTLRGHLTESRITVIAGGAVRPRHLNKHIPYATRPTPAGVRDHSLSTPLDMAVSGDGATLYVAAFGSAKIGVLSTAELEADTFDPVRASAGYIPVSGGGPSGLVLDGHGRLLVATRFDDGVSLIDLARGSELAHVRLTNPEADPIAAGRSLFYDAQASSSNGEAACASCHMFGDTDHLAWDLGAPDGDVVTTPIEIKPGNNLTPAEINGTGQLAALHPMKGPMATQTLLGLVNHGPMHWRGDRVDGPSGRDTRTAPPFDSALAFMNFIGAFDSLLGRDAPLAADDMRRFTDFALAMTMPPSPVRNLDNSLTDAQARGRASFMGCAGLDSVTRAEVVCQGGRPTGIGHTVDGSMGRSAFTCEGCHVVRPELGFFGTDGKMAFNDNLAGQLFKIPQLRNLYTKVGMFGNPGLPNFPGGDNAPTGDQIRGSGFLHDGSVDTLFRFLRLPAFDSFAPTFGIVGGDAERRDLEQFLLAFDSDLAPIVGQQITLDASNAAVVGPRIDLLIARAGTPFTSQVLGGAVTECELVARAVVGGRAVTFTLAAGGGFAPDDGGPAIRDASLRALAGSDGQQITYTCLPPGWPH